MSTTNRPLAQARLTAPNSLPPGRSLAQARYVLPSFVERTSYGIKEMNPYNKLFEERIIFLGVQIDDASANDVIAQLIALESMDPDRDITMYINSPGGSVTSMMAIYDTMQFVQPEIADGLHRPGRLGGGGAARRRHQGQADGAAERTHPAPPARHRGRLRPVQRPGDPGPRDPADAQLRWSASSPQHSGRTEEQVRRDVERDKFFSAEEAKEYGLVDDVLTNLKRRAEVGSS